MEELLGQGGALSVGRDGLELDGIAVAPLAKRLGTPLYVYGRQTLRRRFSELRQALRWDVRQWPPLRPREGRVRIRCTNPVCHRASA